MSKNGETGTPKIPSSFTRHGHHPRSNQHFKHVQIKHKEMRAPMNACLGKIEIDCC